MRSLLQRLSSRELDEFSRQLARELAESYPVEAERGSADRKPDRKADRKLRRALERIGARALEYHASHRLGVYGKARLGNTFKWELKEMGYSEAFVDEATRGLVVGLGRS